ncbi:ABC transporter ATP-binding protein [Saccharopolyspora cebuensis]|uniref:ABC transporter ATP-binding protein n=1 Tax=Saccharopolyspora cebuensis TaxID=418759 RepID=A0ABV4CML4_9PSEU
MTTSETTGQGDGRAGPERSGNDPGPANTDTTALGAEPGSGPRDPFDRDSLPTPKGASRALLGSLLRPHSRRVWAAALLVLLQQAAVQAGPLLVTLTVDHAVPALRNHDAGPLLGVATAYLLCAVAAGILQYVFVQLSGRISQEALLELRTRVFRHSQALSLDFHERYTSGRLITRATTDVENLRALLNNGLQDLITVALSTVYIAVMLLYLDWGLGVAALASVAPLAVFVHSLQQRSMRAYRNKSTATVPLIVKFTETLNGIRAVRVFRREQANDQTFAALNKRHERTSGDATLEMARYVVFSRLVANTAVAVLVVWSAYRVAADTLALGVLAGAALYLRRLYDPIDRLGTLLNAYQAAAASLEKISGLLSQCPGVPEAVAPLALPAQRGAGPGREVVFDSVRFAYRTGGEVLPRFDLTLAAGRSVAVVGATGAGKSTFAKLLARFYDPTGGRVLLDGLDLRELSGTELRRSVVIVVQEAFLFSGTIAENIAIGRPDATREEIEHAAKAIGAHDFITALPDGYDTDVRKRGCRISAGQRQFVSFARALLADPAVLILDEATSSLDVPGERAVQDAMRTVLHGRTAVVIAHRLSTVEMADRVLLMSDGRIVEDGTPAELIAGRGRFAELYQTWRDNLA